MDSTIIKLRRQLDTITKFLIPFLPLANSHMVEFFTDNHWDKLVPDSLKPFLDGLELECAVERFWKIAEDRQDNAYCELGKFMSMARSHYIKVDNELCLSVGELEDRIRKRGCHMKHEIQVKGFMSTKKNYEVQTMSRIVASLYESCGASHCVDVGGGRGHLPTVLALGYSIPSLTVDCNDVALNSGAKRERLIQKQWHDIAKRVQDCDVQQSLKYNKDGDRLHCFVNTFVTRETDLCGLVRNNFPEHSHQDVKLLLTGLHTCGNLGPDSLRLFTHQPSTAAVCNVPCCYHLLTECDASRRLDGSTFTDGNEEGFPMSECLKGYQLGRNPRMLAAKSIDRVASLRELPARSLYHRALLEVLIRRNVPTSPIAQGKLKRISPKCQNFAEYFKAADAILNLNLHDSLSESYLTDLDREFETKWKDLVLFYLLRLCLAQVIESVILLDRLMYLYEKGFKDVYLVKLFDPVLSPRCHSIVAIR